MKNIKHFDDINEGPSAGKKSYNVLAQAFNSKTGEPLAKARVEKVDTDNPIFSNCKTVLDIHDAYEDHWNHLNEEPNENEVVFVASVTLAK